MSWSHLVPAARALSSHGACLLSLAASVPPLWLCDHLSVLEEHLCSARLRMLPPILLLLPDAPARCSLPIFMSWLPRPSNLASFFPSRSLASGRGAYPRLLILLVFSQPSLSPLGDLDVGYCGHRSICPWPQWYTLDLIKGLWLDHRDTSILAGVSSPQLPFLRLLLKLLSTNPPLPLAWPLSSFENSMHFLLHLSSSSALLQEILPGWALLSFQVLTVCTPWDIHLSSYCIHPTTVRDVVTPLFLKGNALP